MTWGCSLTQAYIVNLVGIVQAHLKMKAIHF